MTSCLNIWHVIDKFLYSRNSTKPQKWLKGLCLKPREQFQFCIMKELVANQNIECYVNGKIFITLYFTELDTYKLSGSWASWAGLSAGCPLSPLGEDTWPLAVHKTRLRLSGSCAITPFKTQTGLHFHTAVILVTPHGWNTNILIHSSVQNYTQNRKRKGTEKWRDLWMKVTHKHMETWMIYFGDHRCLFRSEVSKYMWTNGNDGARLV